MLRLHPAASLWNPAPGNHSGTYFTIDCLTLASCEEDNITGLQTGRESTQNLPGATAWLNPSSQASASTTCLLLASSIFVPYITSINIAANTLENIMDNTAHYQARSPYKREWSKAFSGASRNLLRYSMTCSVSCSLYPIAALAPRYWWNTLRFCLHSSLWLITEKHQSISILCFCS